MTAGLHKKIYILFPGEKKFSDLYAVPFIVLSMDENSFGGYWLQIAFKRQPSSIYKIWLYAIDKNEYQIRNFEIEIPKGTTKKATSTLNQFLFEKYGL